MFRFTPTTETVPPAAAQESASSTVPSAPTASMTDSAPRPPVAARTWSGPGATPTSTGSAPSLSARARRSGTRSTARIRAGPKSWAHCRAIMPTGPSPITTTVDPGRMSARDRADVTGGQDVGEKDRLLVGETLGNRQRKCVGEGHAHGLGLGTGEVGRSAERRGLAGAAHIGLSGEARPAEPAADHRRTPAPGRRPPACARRRPRRSPNRWPRARAGSRTR